MISPRHLLNQKTVNRLRRLADILDPGYRLRQMPRTIRGAWFCRRHQVLALEAANKAIGDLLTTGRPAAMAKIGNTELRVVMRWLAQNGSATASFLPGLREEAFVASGIFPPTHAGMVEFSQTWLEALRALDILALWHNTGEGHLAETYCPQATYVREEDYYPYFHADPWSRHLAGRRVLVATSFGRTIERQFRQRQLIWEGGPPVLPDFELDILPIPFSPALMPSGDRSWRERLDLLMQAMEQHSFDVALVGAGALSIPLVAKAKAMGRIGIHLGGATQMLFGIRGRRYDQDARTAGLMNCHWIRPLPEETPTGIGLMENAAYW